MNLDEFTSQPRVTVDATLSIPGRRITCPFDELASGPSS
jgi:hypothetical protein